MDWMRRIALDLLPQATNLHVKDLVLADEFRTPDAFDNLICREDSIRMGEEELQQGEFARRKRNDLPVTGHPVDRRVQAESADCQPRAVGNPWSLPPPPPHHRRL